MKKIIFILLFSFSFSYLHSAFIELNIAKIVAKNFIDRKRNASNTILNVVTEKFRNEISYYVVNFMNGGWVMVSSNDDFVPVLGFDYFGTYILSDDKPEGFLNLTSSYKESISSLRKQDVNYHRYKEIWNSLLSTNVKLSNYKVSSYTSGSVLLKDSRRGEIKWAQDKNYNGTCSPSYNYYCASSSGCDCDRKPVGCAAVAMGQIMWYWQWPVKSSYRLYNWQLMPNILTSSSSSSQGNEVAQFLKDCADAASTSFNSWGSYATTNHIVDAFTNKFYYNAVDKVKKNGWPFAWSKLIRAEIDVGRPVLYRGGAIVDFDDITASGDVHYFVCDGYSSDDPNYFHFNFGWGGSYNSYYYLGNINPNDHSFNESQMAIIGISPSCSNVTENLTSVSYTTVSGTKVEYAKSISLPSNSKSLTVQNGGSLTLVGANMVSLEKGFKVASGGKFKAYTVPLDNSGCGISVKAWTNCFTNGNLYYNTTNANTFQIQVFNLSGQLVYENAGLITSTPFVAWDGTGSTNQYYVVDVTFRNNCGQKLSKSYKVLAANITASKSSMLIDSTKFVAITSSVSESSSENSDTNITIAPNPNNGIFFLKIDNFEKAKSVKIYNLLGHEIFKKENITGSFEIDLSSQPKGIYLIKLDGIDKTIEQKVVIQ
jgi:hypothetical protein